MYPLSPLYSEYLKKLDRTWKLKVDVEGAIYDESQIVAFEIQNTIISGQDFEVGAPIVSTLVLQIQTTDEFAPNAKIVPYLALQLPSSLDGANVEWQDADIAWQDADFPWQGNITEWISLGEFYVDKRQQINGLWEYSCCDKLMFANVAYVSSLTYPTTMQAVWDEICGRLGYTYDNSVQINPSYMIQVGPAGYSMRQMLGYIAGANAASVYAGKDGKIKFRKYGASDSPVFELTGTDYIRAKQTNPVRTFTKVVVVYNTEESLAFEVGTGDEINTLYIENPFATVEMANNLYAALNGFSYMPVTIDAFGYPQIEAGDRIRYGFPVDSPTWAMADVAWQDADYTWDGFETGGGITLALHTVFSFKGGLKMTVEAPSTSEQQSEFPVDGSLTAAVNNLNKTAVKQGKSYFGATLTRTDGLTIEREDHLSKLILNSDVMDWQVNGESALYLDAQEAKLKFNGTLEAVDGTFSGELQAATGTFAGALQAATGTFAGALQAASGTFTGDLIAAGGTFSGNLSAAGGTFTGTLQGVDGTFSGTLQAAGGTFTGTLQGANGSFSGSISASTINGGTITGALIRTTASGTRIELSSSGNLLAAYFDDNNYIAINPLFGSGPAFQFFRNGSMIGSIVMNANDIWINSSGNIGLNTGGTVTFSGASDWSRLSIPGQNLQAALNAKASSGTSTGTSPVFNCGIPIGTQFRDVNGSIWTWGGVPSHSHTQI